MPYALVVALLVAILDGDSWPGRFVRGEVGPARAILARLVAWRDRRSPSR